MGAGAQASHETADDFQPLVFAVPRETAAGTGAIRHGQAEKSLAGRRSRRRHPGRARRRRRRSVHGDDAAAGKRHSGRTGRGRVVYAAPCASVPGRFLIPSRNYLIALFYRVAARRGASKPLSRRPSLADNRLLYHSRRRILSRTRRQPLRPSTTGTHQQTPYSRA
jgi:hypothetical protein